MHHGINFYVVINLRVGRRGDGFGSSLGRFAEFSALLVRLAGTALAGAGTAGMWQTYGLHQLPVYSLCNVLSNKLHNLAILF